MATYANIGTRLVNEERWTAAVGALQRATDFWDAPADTWFLLAKSYEHTGELGKSWYALDKAIELNPVDPAYHVNLINLGTQLYNKGSVLEASAVYLKAIELDSTLTEAYLNLGVLELGENRLPQAEKWIQQAAALAPEDSQIQLYLGVILMKTGKLKTARAALQRVLDLDPQNQEARTLLQTLNP
jgi:tetratricopeptide (TPR) repeat protein